MTRLAPMMVINGRYELHRQLGRGGAGEVYLARDQASDRAVAVKVLFPALATDPGFAERFRREVQAVARLDHPGIVGVSDWGEANGTYFVVMEYVEGTTLASVIADEGRLHPDRAAEIAADIATALGFAHREGGVSHGGVTPGNVLISRSGEVKVGDFGIAGAGGLDDVQGLGRLLYEMLIGRPPFSGRSTDAPRRIDPAIPSTLEAIILKALADNPAIRYPSAEDMASDLRRYLEGARIGAVDQDATAVMPTIDEKLLTDDTVLMAPTPRVPVVHPAHDGGADRYDDKDDFDDEDDDFDDAGPRSYAVIAVLVVVLLVLGGLLLVGTRGRDSGGGAAASDSADVRVPRVIGMQQADAEAALGQADLVAVVETAADETVPAGTVIDQRPAANGSLAAGSQITLIVSSGPGAITVPDLKGMTQDDATQAVTELGLVPSAKQVESDTVPEGTVIDTNPAAGTETTRGATIEIQVSSRPSATTVPDVTGMDEAEARATLEGAGFTVNVTEEPTRRRRRDGRVLSQNPEGGSQAPAGSQVTIVVARAQDRDDDFPFDFGNND